MTSPSQTISINPKPTKTIRMNPQPNTINAPAPVYIGVDVSKATLALNFPGFSGEYPNTLKGHRAIIKRLPKQAHIVMESTGGYQRAFARALQAQSVAVSVVNARQVCNFARALGQLAKSDAIDAEVITRFAQSIKPEGDRELTQSELKLEEIMNRRQQLVELCNIEGNRLEHYFESEIAEDAKALIAHLQAKIKKLETMAKEIIEADAILKAKVERLTQVKGVGLITSASLIAFMPELGRLKRNKAAALVGVAPFVCDSGAERGKRHIWGGRAHLRKLLYMCALHAIGKNRLLKEFYQRLKSAGKPSKVALTAVMRKLICLLNHMLKNPNFSLAS